jgi:hypothetical protein
MAEPEPIDAEFETLGVEPAGHAVQRPPAQRRPFHRRHVTLAELSLGVVLAAVGGAVVAVAATGGNSGAATGTLAREIDMLAAQTAQMDAAVAGLSTRVDEQTVALSARDVRDLALRGDIEALDRQLAAVAGLKPAGDPSANPVGALLARLAAVEAAVAADAASPRTNGQMRRALMDIQAEVAALEEAQSTLRSAFDRRQQAIASLEDAIENVDTDLKALTAETRRTAQTAAVSLASPPATTAASRSRMLRALASVETVAREGKSFRKEHAQLAALLPRDRDVAALKDIAKDGAPSHAQLRASFEVSARDALRVAAQQPDDGWNWLRTTVTGDGLIDRTDKYEFTEDLLRQARRSLELGDARGAAIAVGAIPGTAADAFRGWREDAGRRADLSERLTNLGERLGRKPA